MNIINQIVEQFNFIFPHLSWFYVLCVVTSFIAVIISVWITKKQSAQNDEMKREDELKKLGLQARYKLARQKVIEEKLTPQQIIEEQKSETETLDAIYEILQKRTDMFPNATMNDLKEQLSLYKKN